MMKFKKLCAMLSCVAMFLGTTIGCTWGRDADEVLPGQTLLEIWSVQPLMADYDIILSQQNPNHQQALFTKWVVETFEAKYEGNVRIRITNQGWGDSLNESLNAAIAGGNHPDVFGSEQYASIYVENEHYQAIDIGEYENDMIEQAEAVGKKEGAWRAVPVWTGSLVLHVNKKVLKEANVLDASGEPTDAYRDLDPLAPKTWEDLLEICRAVKAHYAAQHESNKGGMLVSSTPANSAWRALAYMRTSGGGRDFLNDAGEIDVDTEANERAFEMMYDLAQTAPDSSRMSITSENTLWEYFLKNQAAYIVDGMDVQTQIVNYSDWLPAEEAVQAELPMFAGEEKKSNVMIGSVYYGISEQCSGADFEVAQDFIRFLLSDEVQFKVMQMDMRVPTRKSILSGQEIRKQSNFDAMQVYLAPFINPDSEYRFSGGLVGFEDNSPTVWERWDSFIGKLVRDKTTERSAIPGLLETLQTNMTDAERQ